MTSTDRPAPDLAGEFYESVWPLAPLLMRLALLISGDRARAEELAYQTLLESSRTLATRGETDRRLWILANFYRCATAGQHDNAPEPQHRWKSGQSARAAGEPADKLAALSDEQLLLAINGLPREIRWTVLLHDVAGIDPLQVGAILDLPVFEMQSRVGDAHRQLGELVESLAADVIATRDNQVFERR